MALLLAFSLSMGGNGMTVLAVQPGADMSVLTSEEETAAEETNLTEVSVSSPPSDGGGTVTEPPSGGDGTVIEPSADDNVTESEMAGEGEAQKENADGAEKEPSAEVKPEKDNAEQGGTETPAEEEKPAESGTPAEGEEPAESEAPAEGEDPAQSEAPAEGEEPAESEMPDEAEPSVSVEMDDSEELPSDGKGQDDAALESGAPERMLPETQAGVSHIVAFTDDTGMQITYDANAQLQYKYQVNENGVLTAVTMATTVDGSTVDAPVDFSGNVELKQPETGTRYTSIASGVFAGNTKVTYVKLPAGLETIGQETFKGCTGLKGAYLPAGLKTIEESAFEGCTALSQIAVPKTVTRIEDDAFKNDSKLYMVYIKDVDYCDLKSIGDNAFEGCTALAQFCSDTEFLLPSRLESIGKEAFKDCKAIAKIDFKKTKVSEIEKGAFTGCSGLRELTLGEELTLLPEHVFEKCSTLATVNFVNGKKNVTIDRWAFADCYNLKQLVLPQTVVEIRNYAFQGCTELTRVEVKCYNIQLDSEAFPVGEAAGLVIVADESSNACEYAKENGVWPDKDRYYKYTVEDADGNPVPDGAFPEGFVWAGTADQSDYDKNINTSNKKKGVKADGSEKYYIYYKFIQNGGYTFDTSVLRCNGQPVQRDEDGKYYFTMPEGGVAITAGFLKNTPDTIKGTKVTVEFSAGTLLQNGATDEWGYLGVELKVGQTTRMFLLDEDGATIPASRIKQISSKNNKVATVDKNGVITAVGTGSGDKADTQIEAVVLGGDGREIIVRRTIAARRAVARTMTLKASGYPEVGSVQLSGETDGEQTLDVTKSYVSSDELSFQLKANIYDDDEAGISTALTWTTSNAKVAALAKKKTDESDTANVVTIQKGCEGEAVIKVTAGNTSVSQTFVVRVYQDGFRLKSSTVTVNPNKDSTGAITLICGSPKDYNEATKITLYSEKDYGATKFFAEEVPGTVRGNDKVFRIRPQDGETIKDGKYKVKVCVNGIKAEQKLLPLTITVSRKTPKPTIKFNTKKTKFNLFYKDGRMTEDSEAASVTAEVRNLGTAVIRDISLKPLSESENNKLFTDNFVIDPEGTDLSTGIVVIKRSNNGNLKYTSKKKAAVTGYLIVTYVNYEGDPETHVKKLKVTMPTCTKKPSYALKKSKISYSKDDYINESKTANLEVCKKSSKERVVLNAAEYDVEVKQSSKIKITKDAVVKEDGTVDVGYMPAKGTLKLILHNANWDTDKNEKERTLSYTYTVTIEDKKAAKK